MTTGHDELGPAEHGTGPDAEGSHSAGDAPAHGAAGHGPESGDLGPVDFGAWAAGVMGVAVGLLIAACFALATAPIAH